MSVELKDVLWLLFSNECGKCSYLEGNISLNVFKSDCWADISASADIIIQIVRFWCFQGIKQVKWPIPMAAQSEAWVCGRSIVWNVGSNSAWSINVCLFVCRGCCVLWSRALWVRLITPPEENYRVCCVWAWSWIIDNVVALAHCSRCAKVKINPDEW
jgi:hypothetical protein